MKQFLHLPTHPILRQYINFFSYIENEPDQSEEWVAIFPNATTNIAFSLAGEMELSGDSRFKSSISSTCTTTIAMKKTSPFKICTVQLKPHGLYKLIKTPMGMLKNAMSHSDMFFKRSELDDLHEELQMSKTINEVFKILEQFFLQRFGPYKLNQRILKGIELLTDTSLGMDDLSEKLCISNRGLRKIFAQHVGISPKYYQKIMRFNKLIGAIDINPDESLTALSYQAGYFDQAHAIKDFKEFASMSPHHYRTLKANSTDFYNFKTSEPHKFALYSKI